MMLFLTLDTPKPFLIYLRLNQGHRVYPYIEKKIKNVYKYFRSKEIDFIVRYVYNRIRR